MRAARPPTAWLPPTPASGVGTLVELNCETDFVAKGERFSRPGRPASSTRPWPPRRPTPRRCWPARSSPARPCRPSLDEANATIGEKIEVRRVARLRGRRRHVVPAQHEPRPARRRSASSWRPTVATRPSSATSRCTSPRSARAYLTREEIPAETVENERRVAEATAREEGKPEAALPAHRRGSGQRLLQGERPARAAVRQGRQEDRRQGPRGGRRQGQRLRPLPRRRLSVRTQHPDRYAGRARRPRTPPRARGRRRTGTGVEPGPSLVEVSIDRRRTMPWRHRDP